MLPWDRSTAQTPIQRTLSPANSIRPLTAPSLSVPAPAVQPPSAMPKVSPNRPPEQEPPPAAGGAPADQGSNLGMWGYTGPVGINNMEQQALDFINEIYGTQGPLSTMMPAQDHYNRVLSGEFGPEGQAYLQAVLDPMRASAMENYDDMAKNMATRFSNVGGYFGGKHAVSQAKLSDLSARSMAEQEANLRYQRFSDDLAGQFGAAQGLQGLGQAQSGISGDILSYLLAGGNMLTGREMTNRSEYQNALQRSYQDWLRARQEQLASFGWGQNLLGQQATMPVVTQSQSPWGALLGGLGTAAGAYGGKIMGL